MSGRACKAVICCSALAAKIQKIDQLVLRRHITDEDLLNCIIEASEKMEPMLDELIEKIRESD